MFNNLFTTALLATTLAFTSCSKNMTNTTEKADAILEWSGEYMVDGCGFQVTIGDKNYKPENEDDIDEAFKTDEPTAVVIEFVRLKEQIDRRCGMIPESRAMDGIKVISVKKKQ